MTTLTTGPPACASDTPSHPIASVTRDHSSWTVVLTLDRDVPVWGFTASSRMREGQPQWRPLQWRFETPGGGRVYRYYVSAPLRRAHKIAAGLGWRASDGAFAGSGKAPTSSYERRLGPLVFLAPDIQQAILEGRQPPALTLDQLLKIRLPTSWAEQRRALCFDGK